MNMMETLRGQLDRVGAVIFTAVGALLLLLGWLGVSDTAYLAEQTPYIISDGIGGVFLLAIGATLWISADLRDEWRKLDRIEEALGDGTLRWSDAPADLVSADHAHAGPSGLDQAPVGIRSDEYIPPMPTDDPIDVWAEEPTNEVPVAAAPAKRPIRARRTQPAVGATDGVTARLASSSRATSTPRATTPRPATPRPATPRTSKPRTSKPRTSAAPTNGLSTAAAPALPSKPRGTRARTSTATTKSPSK